ncbi:MAG: pyridoxal-dependent decarboxylase [Solirubrobacteraceae bacterium]
MSGIDGIAGPLARAAENLPNLLALASRALVDHLQTLESLPVAPSPPPAPTDVRDWLETSYRFDSAVEPEHAIADIVEHLRRWSVHTGHPRYFGLFNPASTGAGIAGELLAAGLNPQLAAWSHAPAAAEAEQHVLRFFAKRFGLGTGAVAGNITTGGAEANFTALALALTRAFPDHAAAGLRGIDAQPVFYASAESHLAWLKIAQLAGLGRDAVRLVAVDDELRLDVDRLDAMIAADRAAGARPVMLVGTAGTTGSGTLDPLPALADRADAHRLWFHVDAAWAGAIALSDRLATLLGGIERADSVTVDAHKWLSAPMGLGMLVTPHGDLLARAFAVSTGYMPADVAEAADPYAISMQWSRRFAGLKILLSLALVGRLGYAEQLERDVALGRRLADELSADGWQVVNQTPLPVVCIAQDGRDAAWHQDVVDRVLSTGDAWVSVVVLAGRPAIRACVISYRTTAEDVDSLVQALRGARAGLGA